MGAEPPPAPPSKKNNILPTQTNPPSELGIVHMKRQQGSLANFGFSTCVARVRMRQEVGTEVGEGYTSPVLQIYAPKLLGQIQKSPGSPHFLVGFLNFAQKLQNFFSARYASRGCTLKIFPLAALAEGMGYFSKSRKTEKNPENPTQREKKKANLTPVTFISKKKNLTDECASRAHISETKTFL